jgi:threonine dehydratase
MMNLADKVAARRSIEHTERLIRPYIRRTPVIEISGRDLGLDVARLVLKLELMQHTGSFKPRGAFTNLLTRDVPPAGVAAASGGNHGAAVAYAARGLGKRATIFVPGLSAQAKRDRIRSYGADLVVGGEIYDEALAACDAFVARTGALAVHAYDQPETIIGQGTLGLELEEQAPDIDTLLVAVGGGGLIGGVAAWYAGRTRIVGIEPETAPTLFMALAAGQPVDAPAGGIAADSLAPRRVGARMLEIARRGVDHVALVEDAAIGEAQRVLWDKLRLVTEPGGAAAFAALLSGVYRPEPDARVGVVICGGNTGAVNFES